MPARNGHNGKKSIFAPIRENLLERLSNTDVRVRRNLLKLLSLIVCVFLLYTFFSGDYGFIRIGKLHLKKNDLRAENHKLTVKLIEAELTTKRLKTDWNYIEYIARTKHHLSRPGETIYRLKY